MVPMQSAIRSQTFGDPIEPIQIGKGERVFGWGGGKNIIYNQAIVK